TESVTEAEIGTRPVQTPNTTGSLWANYELQAGPLAGLGLGGGVRYLGSSFGDVANTVETPDATLADAAAYYTFDRFRFQVNVQNVFDNEYIAAAFVRDSPLVTIGARRQISAGLSVQF
ncbi:MAG: TonB-dependent receptor, partial [Bacteroidota bacterium]